MVIHVGYLRAGWRGLLVAGTLFILPAAMIVLALAWTYVDTGATPTGESLLYGIKPVVIAVVAQALWGLGRTALKGPLLLVVGMAATGLYLFGFNELAILFGGAASRPHRADLAAHVAAAARNRIGGARWRFTARGLARAATSAGVPVSLTTLFLTFLKIGAVLYGSGYVLLAFLRGDFVERLGWLTDQQLLDAVAVGQFTPGPVFTTATFVGYLVAGVPGAILATRRHLPALLRFRRPPPPLVPHLRRPWTAPCSTASTSLPSA